jgi:glycosyltransferase involved in cell wall biosynthesis
MGNIPIEIEQTAAVGVLESSRVSEATQKALNVLIVTARFLPFSGGVQTYVELLATGLSKRGHHATVATISSAMNFNDGELPFQVERQPNPLRLWKLIGEADVVQLAGPRFLPLIFALVRAKPIMIEHHGYQAICPNGLLLYQPAQTVCPGHFMNGAHKKCLDCINETEGSVAGFWHWLLTFPRRRLCQMVEVNAPITEHVLHRLGLPRSRVIYYGIPDTAGSENHLVAISPQKLCFAYVGRLVAEKGLPLLVEAASRLRDQNRDFQVRFVGDGPERARLERMVQERQLASFVTFTGFLRGEELRQAAADVAAVVMPSICEETAGLSAIEQMMRGRLVIASNIGGLGEVVGDVGLKFAPGNVEQLAACMQRVIDHPELVSTMGSEARRRSLAMFHENRMIEDHLTAYREMLQKRTALVSGYR